MNGEAEWFPSQLCERSAILRQIRLPVGEEFELIASLCLVSFQEHGFTALMSACALMKEARYTYTHIHPYPAHARYTPPHSSAVLLPCVPCTDII